MRIDEILPFPASGKDAPVLTTPDVIRPEGAHTNQPRAERIAALGHDLSLERASRLGGVSAPGISNTEQGMSNDEVTDARSNGFARTRGFLTRLWGFVGHS